ncbi:subtilase-type protease inhibitor [Streptomyces sp. NPDC060194]|uniref:subtilase-type protease inhibitor n=1 Tax=Streptomyces sp. NPDC060194 TaxID=3347069 RepID=UPI0036631824
MRRTLLSVGTAAALILTATATGAAAEPASAPPAYGLYAPSAITLGIARGSDPATATVERAVTLSCAPRATGTHPDPQAACSELRSVQGRLASLVAESPTRMCTRQFDPVTVTADGVWDGRRVNWSASFGNACELAAHLDGRTLYAF